MSRSRRTLSDSRAEGSDVEAHSNDESGPASPVNGAKAKHNVQQEVDAQVANEMS
jgi:hypothetical protein